MKSTATISVGEAVHPADTSLVPPITDAERIHAATLVGNWLYGPNGEHVPEPGPPVPWEPYFPPHKPRPGESAGDLYPHLVAECVTPGVSLFDYKPGSRKILDWQCEQGHKWRIKLSSRTKVGNGCRACSCRGTSRIEQQIREALARLLPLDLDNRLPNTSPSPAKWWSVDAVSRTMGFVVEYDGSYWHHQDGPASDAVEADSRKSDDLRAQGWTLIRVREAPLEALHPHDIVVRRKPNAEVVAAEIAARLRELGVQEVA